MNRAFRDIVRRKSTLTNLSQQSSPKILSSTDIRNRFLDYFCKENGHLNIRSSPVFSLKDPTLAFTNAGMNQFKEVFLGIAQPASKRVANSQKCIRIGGVHNDLSEVGQDGMHHTFFEMLGNWSFGDYFKVDIQQQHSCIEPMGTEENEETVQELNCPLEGVRELMMASYTDLKARRPRTNEEACRMAWDLLTKEFNLPPKRLYMTYFKGDQSMGLDPDLEVKEIWRKIGVEESHILAFGAKENFWTGSVTGPCGPCTEIHYDMSSGIVDAGFLVNSNSNAIIELWNLVFTQYDRDSDGTLSNLKTHFVDTGMGFERLVAVLQGKVSNYDTDLFSPLFKIIEKHTKHSGYTGEYYGNPIDTSYRVIADHSRMITVALSDGMIPNQQYKLRGIIKKTLSVIKNVFKAKEDLLKELTTQVADSLTDAYPELEKNLPKIHYIIEKEAEVEKMKLKAADLSWAKIVSSYPPLQSIKVKDVRQITNGWDYIKKNILDKKKTAFSHEDIFTLYETHGIPTSQLQEIASKLNLHLDINAYKIYELSVKENERKVTHRKLLNSFKKYTYLDVLNKLEEKKIQPTYDFFKYEYKVDGSGKYVFKEQPTTVEAILCGNEVLDEITPEDVKDGKEIGIILDRTQLFSEEGSQESDFGTLEIENGIIFDIEKLVKIKNFVIHFGNFRNFSGNSKVAAQSLGTLKINEERRISIMRNHTALHLLNAALRQELYVTGEKTSKATSDGLTLNYMVYKNSLKPTKGVQKVEKYVKDCILHGVSVKRKIITHPHYMSLDDIIFIPGESTLEHETPVIEINSGFKISREFCTGTHVLNTSHIQDFIITNYVKGSYNVHKIKAVTGGKCSEIRKIDSESKEKWSNLEKEISENEHSHMSKLEPLFQKVNDLLSEVSESATSYVTRVELIIELQKAKKNLNDLLNTSFRKFLTEEIQKASSTTPEKFVVLVLDFSLEFPKSNLDTATSACNDKPLLIFFKKEDSFFVQCAVPKGFVSEKFSAQEWLTNSLINYCWTASFITSNLSYYTVTIKSSEAKLRQAVNIAIDFAKKNIKSEHHI